MLMFFYLYVAYRYDLLDLCTNGPKEKLDSTVISQVCYYSFVSTVCLVWKSGFDHTIFQQ